MGEGGSCDCHGSRCTTRLKYRATSRGKAGRGAMELAKILKGLGAGAGG